MTDKFRPWWDKGQVQRVLLVGGTPSFGDIFPDMTAIVIASTINGCIVAADGRSRYIDPDYFAGGVNDRKNDCEQKIFNDRWSDSDFVYAVMGSISSGDTRFSAIAETQDAIRSLSATQIRDPYSYTYQLAAKINEALASARKGERCAAFKPNPDRGTIFRIFVLGYFLKPEPTLAILRFRHSAQVLLDPEITMERPPESKFFGSPAVSTAVKLNPALATYRTELNFSSSLDEAATCAKGFIEAHSDPLAIEIDPITCWNIGGHTHIAELTPAGFKWRIEPKRHAATQ
jgi:hypothetical protein